MSEIKNAIICDTQIAQDDHGTLSIMLTLDYGGAKQGFGGQNLYLPNNTKPSANYAGHFIWRVLEIVEVDNWDKLKGKPVRAKIEDGYIRAIGNIIKDKWFNVREELLKLKP